MPETPAEELVRRGKILAGRVEPKCTGNGSYNREYEIGRISLVIDGWWGTGKEDWNKEYDTGLFVELGDVEVLDSTFDNEQIQSKVDPSVVERVLEVVRSHMVLEDLADV
jgi:hypothetical protein